MKKFTTILFFFLAIHSFSQYNDAGLWLSSGFEKKLKGRYTAFVTPVIRMNENVTEVGSAFLDGGIEYKINKHIRVSGNYRFAGRRRLDDTYSLRNRFYVDCAFRKKISLIVLNYRFRIQTQFADYFTSRNGKNPDYALRNKIQLKFDLNQRYMPFVSGEIWYTFKNMKGDFTNMRYVGGVDYDLNKRNGITLSYIFQRQINVSNPVTDYIISVGFNHVL